MTDSGGRLSWAIWIGGVVAVAALSACGESTVVEGAAGSGGSGGSAGAGGIVGGGGGSAGEGGSAGAGGNGGSTSSGGPPSHPPPPPDDGVPGDGPGYAFVFTKVFWGDTDRDGTPSDTAWRQYGYDLDGKISTEQSTDLCQPASNGSPEWVYPDGDSGIDNVFGMAMVKLITAFTPNVTQQTNQAIASGQYSYLIAIDDLGNGPSYLGLPSRAYEGSLLGQTPIFDGSDSWPVTAESLSNPNDITSALFQFTTSYVNGHHWVSSPPGSYEIRLLVDYPLVLSLQHAVITMELSPDRSSGSNGIIAGILEVEPFIEEVRKLLGSSSPSLCEGTTFDSLADSIRQASDILSDGTQDPNKTCDAISVGLGFEASAVQLGGVAAPAPPPADPCAE